MNNRDIELAAADFMANLDPLFRERPVYPVVMDDSIPPFFVPCGRISAWTSPWCDLLLRPWLERTGRWQGRGLALLLEPPPASDWTDLNWLGVVCHEAGHLLTFSETLLNCDFDSEPESIQRALASQATPAGFADRVAQEGEELWSVPPTQDRRYHDPNWIRATLHLVHRSNWRAAAHTTAATSVYGYAPGFAFDAVLEDEANELRNIPIREILKTAPPPRFTELVNEPSHGIEPR